MIYLRYVGSDVSDNTVIYVHTRNKEQAALKLNETMINLNKWLNDC